MKKLAKGEALMLRTCNADGTSYGGFKWPNKGPVKCSKWDAKSVCGNGLHGLLWGEGKGSLLDWSETAAWLVVRIKEAQAISITDKIKVPSGVVEFFGSKVDAVAFIQKYAPAGKAVVGGTATAGYRGTATAGEGGAIAILYRNGNKYRRAVFEVVENGCDANQPYQVDKEGKLVKVMKP